MSDVLRSVFNTFDKDGNGFLDKNELKAAFKDFKGGLTDQAIDAIIADADTNNDGMVNFEEFVALINKLS